MKLGAFVGVCASLVFPDAAFAQATGGPSATAPSATPAHGTPAAPSAPLSRSDPARDPSEPIAAAPVPSPTPGPATKGASQAPAALDDTSGCQDTWPKDRTRPRMFETFPKRGLSGHAATLKIEVEHLPGEVVFPAGLTFSPDAPELAHLEEAHFVVPARESAVGPTVETTSAQGDENKARTIVRLPVIPLPEEAGRHELTLPRFPIAIARASGQVHTICTDPHVIVVEDPLASVPQPSKEPDPQPRKQHEVWSSLRDIVLTLAWAVPLVLMAAWLFVKYGSKLKKPPPPPPPIPPWQTAREQLAALRRKGLADAGLFEEELDGICDILRRYLGARYGFEGLECTTRELLRALAARAPDFPEEESVRTILQRADLVKFARRAPSKEECSDAFSLTERIVEKTTASSLDPRTSGATPTTRSSS